MSNLRPGIDDDPADFMFFVKLNVPFDDRAKMIATLKALQTVQDEMMNPARTFSAARLPDGDRKSVV